MANRVRALALAYSSDYSALRLAATLRQCPSVVLCSHGLAAKRRELKSSLPLLIGLPSIRRQRTLTTH